MKLISAVILLLIGFGASSIFGAGYTVVDLNTLGGDYSCAYSVNNFGQVVGDSTTAEGDSYGFVYSGGSMTSLDPLYCGMGINDSGEICGDSEVGFYTHAFRYSGTTATDLFPSANYRSYTYAINNSGVIVGGSTFSGADTYFNAYKTVGNTPVSIGTLGGRASFALGINNAGDIVGHSQYTTLSGYSHAFVYIDGQMIDMGTLGGVGGEACGINENRHIVGSSSDADSGRSHAFLYIDGFSNGQMNGSLIDLGASGAEVSIGCAINNSDQVVGAFVTQSENVDVEHAFLYENGIRYDLNDLIDPSSGWILNRATDINDDGLIVGFGLNPQGESHAFMLTKNSQDPPSTVPEPETIMLLFCAIIAIGKYKVF